MPSLLVCPAELQQTQPFLALSQSLPELLFRLLIITVNLFIQTKHFLLSIIILDYGADVRYSDMQ